MRNGLILVVMLAGIMAGSGCGKSQSSISEAGVKYQGKTRDEWIEISNDRDFDEYNKAMVALAHFFDDESRGMVMAAIADRAYTRIAVELMQITGPPKNQAEQAAFAKRLHDLAANDPRRLAEDDALRIFIFQRKGYAFALPDIRLAIASGKLSKDEVQSLSKVVEQVMAAEK